MRVRSAPLSRPSMNAASVSGSGQRRTSRWMASATTPSLADGRRRGQPGLRTAAVAAALIAIVVVERTAAEQRRNVAMREAVGFETPPQLCVEPIDRLVQPLLIVMQ